MKIHVSLGVCVALFWVLPPSSLLQAGPLTEARVNKIINEVIVLDPTAGAHPAALQEVIKDQIGLKTGIKSRSELLFQDNTLTRIGPESFFTFKPGTREMELQKGSMLLQVPKGLGGAKIRTAAVTASITGTTIMMEYHPNKNIKVLVLEGSLRLSVNGRFGDSLLLRPGKMVIMHPNDRRIPDPVSVDLATVIKTSSLVKMSGNDEVPLPSMALINKEIDVQANQKDGKHLINTNLVILGGGTNVVMASDTVIDTLDKKTEADPIVMVSNGNGNGGPAATPRPTATPFATPGPTATPFATPAPTATPSGTPAPTATPSATPAPTATPSATPAPTATPSATPTPTATPSATPTPAGSPVVISNPGDITISTPIVASAVQLKAGGKLTVNATIDAGSLVFDAGQNSKINATITAGTLSGTVFGDLDINCSLDADVITLDITKELKYSIALVAPARNGTLLSAPADGRSLTIHAEKFELKLTPGNSSPITLNGGNAAGLFFAGGSGGVLNVGTAARPIQGPIDVKAPIEATTGRNGAFLTHGGDGGSVGLVTNDKIKVESNIKVSDSAAGRASRKGGNIVLDSRRTGSTAIEVKSSAQLLSLLSATAPGPGGSIKLTSAGGEIKMEGTARADRGTVDIRNNGNGGLVTLKTATLHGDVVKVGALGNNGTLIVDGGNISADSTIKLYAGGSNGTVEFKDNVTLSGTSVKTIFGNTVTIYDGKIVTVNGSGPAQVFTNNPNYTGSGGNGSTSGIFSGLGATTQPLSAGPGY